MASVTCAAMLSKEEAEEKEEHAADCQGFETRPPRYSPSANYAGAGKEMCDNAASSNWARNSRLFKVTLSNSD